MTREEKRQQRRARIDARRERYRGKRQDLISERAARREEPDSKSDFWGDAFEVVGIFVLGILEALG